MKKLYEEEPRLRLFHPRETLTKIHLDLFKIHRVIAPYASYYPEELTNFERLTLVLEDRRFFGHYGIDLISSVREVFRALTFRRHGGASTIDMQLVRTATGYRRRTIGRKLYEMLLALLIQFRYSKVVILRSYLRCAFFGSHLKGSNSAAFKVFGCSADALCLDDAAFLAAMLVCPRPLDPKPEWISRVKRRASYGKSVYLANKQRFDQLPCR